MSVKQRTYILIFYCVIIHATTATAQNEAINWCFGSNVGLSFNTSPPTTVTGYSIHTYEGCAVISDSMGGLLFYTDGVSVWNKLHQVMPNGTGLQGHSSSSQSAIIIPAPGTPGVYYIVTAPEINTIDPMSYSIVDVGLNGGLGGVVVKNALLLVNSLEKVSAVRHQNGTDYWVVAHEYGNANFRSYLVTQGGINTNAIVSTVGNAVTDTMNKLGIIKISPCGTQLAMTNHGLQGFIPSTLELFNFDNGTGVVSNAMQVCSSLNGIYGLEFSPDNSKLYMAYILPGVIVQYDITSGNLATIVASADTIGQSSSYLDAMQTGPDGKIYVAKYNSLSLGCITNPNLSGIASNYVHNYVTLVDSCFLGLPGFVTSFFCNSGLGISDAIEKSITVSPNPFISGFTISLPGQNPSGISVKLTDLKGREIKTANKAWQGNKIEIPAEDISTGIYIISVETTTQIFREKIVKLDR